MKRTLTMLAAAGALTLATLTTAAPALADEVPQQQEFQCSPGLLGTGLLCNQAPLPGPPPEDDIFQGGLLGADSPLLELLGFLG